MSFSKPDGGNQHTTMGGSIPTDMGGTEHTAGGVGAAAHSSFGDRLGAYMMQRNPLVGGLAQMVFGGDPNQNAGAHTVAPVIPVSTPPIAPLPNYGGEAPQSDLIGMNAKPPSGGGGLSAILQLIGA